MDIAVRQFYERQIDLLVKAERDNQQDYQSVKASFFQELENHIDHAQKLSDVIADLKSVSKHLLFIDDRIQARARHTYRDIPAQLKTMGDMLRTAHENMDLSIKNENYKDACKFVVIQAEIICEYLMVEFDLLNTWIRPDPQLSDALGLIKNGKDVGYLTAWYKIKACGDFCGQSWENPVSLKIVKDIRDYGSHGYHEASIKKQDIDIETVSKDYAKYFREWFVFIRAVKLKLYSKYSPVIFSIPIKDTVTEIVVEATAKIVNSELDTTEPDKIEALAIVAKSNGGNKQNILKIKRKK